jgi:hypothetical protein
LKGLVKYPKTYHLPWSEGACGDDRTMPDVSALEGEEIVVTEKMDGENTTMYSSHVHARSVDGRSHATQEWVRNFWSRIRHGIPEGWRVCGENMYAEHSIHYDGLPSYFLGFSVWNDRNECLPWDETVEWFDLLEICPVAEIHRGMFDCGEIEEATLGLTRNRDIHEGYVVRVSKGFPMSRFRYCIGKYVRGGHVQSARHWKNQRIVLNRLK